ncbi:hypothetical protein [Sorangium sp. So ce426]|uniref:hypothetical protein n=1 Tax=Sorangium sp. So ce426 TaxID=3133312 RepID=UPI003F5C48E7
MALDSNWPCDAERICENFCEKGTQSDDLGSLGPTASVDRSTDSWADEDVTQMVRSPHSQGKGSRRFPGRPGGAGSKPPLEDWRRHTSHAAARAEDLEPDRYRLWLRGDWDTSAAELAYKVDQAFAQARIPYFPIEYHGWHTGLQVVIPARFAEAATAVHRRFEEERPRPAPSVGRGWTSSVEPQRLSKQYSNHPWIFRRYSESLPDGRRYEALLFRDEHHEHFGKREWVMPAAANGPGAPTLRKLAWRIVTDPDFRNELLSDDPELKDFWR